MPEDREHPRNRLEQPIARALIALVLLAALGATAFAVWLQRGDGDDGELIAIGERPTSAGTAVEPEPNIGALDDRRPIIGQPAPDFALREVDGDVVRLSELRGSVVFINFWATWCLPCREEMPAMERLYREHRDAGFVMVAVSVDADSKVVPPFVTQHGLTFPVALDGKMDVANAYGVRALPSSFIVDAQGNLAALALGPRAWDNDASHALVERMIRP